MATVETAYSLDDTDGEWLSRVLDAMRPDFEREHGSYAFTCRVDRGRMEMSPAYVERQLDPAFGAVIAEMNRTAPEAVFDLFRRNAVIYGSFVATVDEAMRAHFDLYRRGTSIGDALSLVAQDGEGHAISVTAPSTHRQEVSSRVRGIWKRVGVHIASAMRLRRRFATARERHDAVFSTEGVLLHAEGSLKDDRDSRRQLAEAVRSMERARTARERESPERALQLWRGLVGGQWSLVDSWENGGRRFVAAYANAPHVADPRALTPLERVVFRYATLCASNKEIAFTLGVSESTVANAVSDVLRKLRCRRRSDLVAFSDVERAEHARVDLGGEAIDVLSFPSGPSGEAAALLTPAEREVAAEIVRGRTNAEIARRRGTSPHTIAKQVRGMFEKLGLRSRPELVRALIK